MTTVKTIFEGIALAWSLYYTFALIGKSIEFYCKAMLKISTKIEDVWYTRTAIGWMLFYILRSI